MKLHHDTNLFLSFLNIKTEHRKSNMRTIFWGVGIICKLITVYNGRLKYNSRASLLLIRVPLIFDWMK